MKAVIVAAGEGNRLRNISQVKPLAMLAGKTLAERALWCCAHADTSGAVLILGYQAETIIEHLDQVQQRLPISLEWIVNDDWRDGNGTSVRAAKTAVYGDDFILLMCDHVVDPAIVRELVSVHRPADVDLILGVDRRLDNPLVDLADVTRVQERNGRILSIGKSMATYNCFDTGVFRMSSRIFAIIGKLRAQRSSVGISEIVRIVASKGRARAYDIGDRFWIDVDDDRMHALAEATILSRSVGAHLCDPAFT